MHAADGNNLTLSFFPASWLLFTRLLLFLLVLHVLLVLPDLCTYASQCGEDDPNLFCTGRPRNGQPGTRNNEYISIFADQASVLQGRTALECYADFMHAFRDAFIDDIGLAIHEIAVGGGPCGELRYPSYVETQGWRFPGVALHCNFCCFLLSAHACIWCSCER